MRKFLLTLALLMSLAQFAPAQQKVFGTFTCLPDSGVIYDSSLPAPPGSVFYTHDQCAYSLRPDGHGTFHIATEVGVTQTGLFQFNIHFPFTFNLQEVHGMVNLINWCSVLNLPSKVDGFTLLVTGQTLGGPIENINSIKAISLTGEQKDYIVKADYPTPIPMSDMSFYYHTDNCSWSTFSQTLDGVF